MLTSVAIVLGTFVSEDATCIAAGLLIQRGQISLARGILACIVGIYVGDLGLWALGRVSGAALLRWRWARQCLSHRRVRDAHDWLERHAAGAIVGSRLLPGTRFVLYVMAGVLRLSGAVFAIWSLIAALLWTPTLVLLSASLGDAFAARLSPLVGSAWSARVGAGLVAFIVVRAARKVAEPGARRRLSARLARWSRWEFWPAWLFYLPVSVWIAWLAIRHRGLATITAANPGMPDGGLVGESKFAIQQQLLPEWTVPSTRIASGAIGDRLDRLRGECEARCWQLPVILKPDVGQRGVGVRLIRTWDSAADYFTAVEAPVVAQPYHPGPFEAGIFYYRLPAWRRGRIFSIADKHFPVLVGDGRSTIERLIWSHPRFRLQASTFVARHETSLDRVLAAGERFPIAVAGNHCQGTLFRSGRHLITPALEDRIDEIARACPGFFIGRFDVRYSDVDAFMAGRDLAIVELNGVTSESTDIYDPDGSLWSAYRRVFEQWQIIFTIGHANRAAGAPATSIARLLGLAWSHITTRPALSLSD